MDCIFKIDNSMKEHEEFITCEFGFRDFSISDYVKEIKESMRSKSLNRILDLGCGNGSYSIYFNNNGFDVYACDVDCKKISNNLKKLNIKNINVCKGSYIDLPYDDNFFDAVICSSTLHHAAIGNIKRGINEIYRVLKPYGYFVFDFLSKKDKSYGLGREIEKDTFVGSREGEEDVPHHYTDEYELKSLLNSFSSADITNSIYFFNLDGSRYTSNVFDVTAIK